MGAAKSSSSAWSPSSSPVRRRSRRSRGAEGLGTEDGLTLGAGFVDDDAMPAELELAGSFPFPAPMPAPGPMPVDVPVAVSALPPPAVAVAPFPRAAALRSGCCRGLTSRAGTGVVATLSSSSSVSRGRLRALALVKGDEERELGMPDVTPDVGGAVLRIRYRQSPLSHSRNS